MPKYIDADKLRERINGTGYDEQVKNNLCFMIATLPAADVASVVHGRWERTDICDDDPWRCSRCGNTVSVMGYKICPNCGARMDLDGEDEDNV